MIIGKCPSCEQRLMVDIPKCLPKFEARTCEYCGKEYGLSHMGWEIWEPYLWESRYEGLACASSFEGAIQEFSVDGPRIREPIYPEVKLAELLGKDPRTLSRWRESSKISYYRFGLSIFYGESHIREWLWSHISDAVLPEEWQLDLALDCMRRGHSPFSLQDALEYQCPNGHWLSTKQMFAYLSGCIARRTPPDEIVEEFSLIMGGIRNMQGGSC